MGRNSLLSSNLINSFFYNCSLSKNMVAFSLQQLVKSNGDIRDDCSNRFLEITHLPTEDQSGKGKYFCNGEIISVFTFQSSKDGFDGTQRNGNAFRFDPVLDSKHKPIGFVWTFPEALPKFRARFVRTSQCDEKLYEVKQGMKKGTVFGKFNRKLHKVKDERVSDEHQHTLNASDSAYAFAEWQEQFIHRHLNEARVTKVKSAHQRDIVHSGPLAFVPRKRASLKQTISRSSTADKMRKTSTNF